MLFTKYSSSDVLSNRGSPGNNDESNANIDTVPPLLLTQPQLRNYGANSKRVDCLQLAKHTRIGFVVAGVSGCGWKRRCVERRVRRQDAAKQRASFHRGLALREVLRSRIVGGAGQRCPRRRLDCRVCSKSS